MIKIELDETEVRELMESARDCCRIWLDNMEAIAAGYSINDVRLFDDEEYKTAFFHSSKLASIVSKIEDSLNKE